MGLPNPKVDHDETSLEQIASGPPLRWDRLQASDCAEMGRLPLLLFQSGGNAGPGQSITVRHRGTQGAVDAISNYLCWFHSI